MCMFCVIQKWSRRIATMLPWLVIPLIGLWALSQLLPPAFRFEITSPRLACVFVLLVTLFWYEVLMPQLSAWRVRRNARLRERKRFEALELQKLRKTATRKCRNCLTPYRDQNPGIGGKFMCSYCGHISKRPVLDLPMMIPPGMMSNSGLIKELLGKGGKILNGGKNWSENVSLCNQEWLENGSWVVNGSFPVKSSYPPRKSGVSLFGRSEPCLAEKSYSGVYFFACKLLTSFLLSVRWLWRKLFRISSSEDLSSDADHRGMLSKKGEGGVGHESRGEKARRKAEEKRQARLERELLEEEERKQREEVARLVEERRRLRDEKLEAENRAKGTTSLREKDSKKAERKRQERRKEMDKGSSKSNSDVDELEKKASKDYELKRDMERKSENDRRDSPKAGVGSGKGHYFDGAKSNSPNNFSRGNVGSRYFDRMRGTFLSSSKALTGSGFFGRAAPTFSPVSKEVKSNISADSSSVANSRHDFHTPERLLGKVLANGDDKVNIRPVTADGQRKTSPMSWHQLFTGTSPANPTVISRPSAKSQKEGQISQLPSSVSSAPLYDNPIDLPSPFTLPPFSSGPVSSRPISAPKDPSYSSVSNRPRDVLPEEPELFEDPCYEPDPVSLLGPVSESLDNFQLDRGGSYIQNEIGISSPMVNSSSAEVSRPSPIESPLSRMRVADEKQHMPGHFSGSPRALDMQSFAASDLNNNSDIGTWHMWNSSPLGPDGLSLVGGATNWITPSERSRLSHEDMMHHSPPKTMASLFSKEGPVASGAHSPQQGLIGNARSCGFGASIPSSNDQDPWLQKAYFPPLVASENHNPGSPSEDASQKQVVFGSLTTAAPNHAVDPSKANCWSKNEWSVPGSREGVRNLSSVKPPVGGLYSAPNVQSLWSFNEI